MNDADDFWLYVTRMAESLDEGGLTTEERMAYAMQAFDQMPTLAQREVLAALRKLAVELPDLFTIAAGRSLRTGNGKRGGPQTTEQAARMWAKRSWPRNPTPPAMAISKAQVHSLARPSLDLQQLSAWAHRRAGSRPFPSSCAACQPGRTWPWCWFSTWRRSTKARWPSCSPRSRRCPSCSWPAIRRSSRITSM